MKDTQNPAKDTASGKAFEGFTGALVKKAVS
jgi:hypothetical protein